LLPVEVPARKCLPSARFIPVPSDEVTPIPRFPLTSNAERPGAAATLGAISELQEQYKELERNGFYFYYQVGQHAEKRKKK
jgi:hypothetical protein